jgi:hypothetical protein
MGRSTWTKDDVDTLVKMWKSGMSSNKIADKLKRRRSAVTQFICRNRVKLGLEKRGHDFGGRPKRGTFDQQWHGPVPCGHWMITKPWRKQA